MTDLIKVSPSIVDDIEFYISNDASIKGVSVVGLARLCGIDRSTISNVVNDLNRGVGKNAPNQLECLQGKVFTPLAISNNGAKIVDHKAASRIIRYYAYESRSANDIAKYSYDKFAEIGIGEWITELTGFKQEKESSSGEVLTILKKVLTELENVKEITVEYKQIRSATSVVVPGIDKLLNDYRDLDIKTLLLQSGSKVPLYLWVQATKGCTLDKSTMHRFAHLVSGAYKSATGKEPERRNIKKGKHKDGRVKYQPNTSVYSEDEFPILDMAWTKLMCS